ncbi:Bug family tripartite tricarboxylate transporter substrate binding protein [Aquincola tertiaricarbonis]|uniref:Bug family tripartite tricarboxylate transporter substrate binding protein n=1 Tax=Aquincola tertiaricarbonis TaxID=391953 RepID=A0ABY4SBA1_AQUTE|nr:Bug family tripartite tricarboxylate transporter substrate binding protein [Aquincola tertiaricarbonis]URI08570.1 Bug family tripartite tricarboxylate transporter substrate binding protein [Aquincola tertiaricarbonis]
MVTTRREFIRRSAALSAATAAAPALFGTGAAQAQQPPTVDALRIVTGFAAGGTSDTVCRRLAEGLRGIYARNALVENKTGAGGQIAIASMKQAPADGTVMLQTPASMLTIYPHIYKKLQYDPFKDLVPVSVACTFEFALAVGPVVPASVTNVPEFLAWVKAHPEHANFGSPAAGSTPHFTAEMLSRAGGAGMRHVPYRGTQPAVLDLTGGQIASVSGPIGDFLPHLGGGRVRLLGVSGAKRSRFVPQTPTYAEQGIKDVVTDEWFAFYLPAGTSPEIAQRANAAMRTALAKPEVIDGLAAMGLEARSSTQAELADMQRRDTERWGPIVKAVGFTAD